MVDEKPKEKPKRDFLAEAMSMADAQYGPRARRIEIGSAVGVRFKALTSDVATPLYGGEIERILALPIVKSDKLGAKAWRVLDESGHVLSEGVIE